MKIRLAGIVLLVISFGAHAQSDTVYLQEVEIVMPRLLKYNYGGNLKTIKKKTSNQNLSELISENNASYFKNYGNGQLSTITLRGTTAAHTSVVWNGIPVNSPTLGLTDFSLWPSYLLDNLALHIGGSSSSFGSGAIGGTVVLNHAEPIFDRGITTNINLELGSFGNYTTAGTFNVSRKKIISQTKIYRNSIENDFEIRSENRKQNNASIVRYGFDQQLHFKINGNQFLTFEGLYVHHHRQNQPLKFDTSSTDELLNENLRLSLNYQNESGKGIWNSTFGYVIYDQRFNVSSKTKINQVTLTSHYDRPIGQKASIKTGLSYSNYTSDVETFINQINENRVDVFAALNYSIKNWWRISFNLRKGFYTDRSFPFVPSIGQEFDVVKTKKTQLLINALVSKSHRIPTLNDRFWGTQGNPDLTPEDGNHAEIGIAWKEHKKNSQFNLSITHYRSWIDELIIWLPTGTGGIFMPQNNKKVNIIGLEISSRWITQVYGGTLSTMLNYNYTKSTNQKGLNEFDQTGLGKQLPYVPFHSANVSIQYEKSGWTLTSFFEYTGNRFTTLDNSPFNEVNSFQLLNLTTSKMVQLKSIEVHPYFKLNNIMNRDYENFKNYAMPGRNFLIGMNLNF